VTLDPQEVEILVDLLLQVRALLDDGAGGRRRSTDPLVELTGLDLSPDPVPVPEDPAVARLLPEAHREDPEAAQEFRRLTERGLRRRKSDAISAAVEALRVPSPSLSMDVAAGLLKAMTDVRLVLAERLGLHSDEDAVRIHSTVALLAAEQHPMATLALLYDVLTWWQECLVDAVGG
jgi:hypothetical protein